MKSLNQSIKIAVLFMFLGSAMYAWGYTNPIDGATTETVTNLWDVGTNRLYVGVTTSDNAMIITNGGSVISKGGMIGSSYNVSQGNRVTVTGTGSIWSSSGDVRLSWHNNELLITDGGRVDSTGGIIEGGYDNLVMVNGTGSVWSNSAKVQIGSLGWSSGMVIITNGGHLYSNNGSFGDESGAGFLVVTGPGSVYKNSGYLAMSAGDLLISDGGRVENTSASVFYPGTSATVTGAGSTWINSDELEVWRGKVFISDGGRVESNGGRIGYNGSGEVTVTGAGSTWNNAETFEVREGGSATVSNGGAISTASLAIEGGTFHLQSGGKLAVSSDFDAAQPGTFDFTGGTFSVGGNLTNLFMLAAGCRLEAADISGDLMVHGTFAPGQSPANAMLDGAFVLAGDGALEMELAGYLLGTEYDRLTVTGESTLDGTLVIVLLDDFAPVYGTSFDLFNWEGGVSGTFGVTNLPTLGNGLYWDTSNLYTDGTVTVVPEPATFMLLGMGGLFAGLVRKWSRVSV